MNPEYRVIDGVLLVPPEDSAPVNTPAEPTQEERNAADIQYLSMMMGVDLDV